jgi:CheY-like chemotaxis protein
MPVQDEFLQQVRDALNHLYDYPYLENHPLAVQCWPEVDPGSPNRAQRLSRLLLEAIEELHPPTFPAKDSSRAQGYLLLVSRYVEEQPLSEIVRDLSYSRRQFFREQRKAIAMLAALLWEKLPQKDLAQVDASFAPDDILDTETRRFRTQHKALDPAEVVEGALKAVGSLAKERGVAMEHYLEAEPQPVYGNRTLLRQVLVKALSTLITHPGTQTVILGTRCAEGQSVSVELTGRFGLAASQPDGVPEMEYQRPDMVPVGHLAKMAGGRWHEVEIGPETSTYRFEFPPTGERVLLVVEDNEAIIRAFRRYTSGYGYRVVGATTGAEALQLAREFRPSAITLDVMMPSQDGWEILQELKNDAATRHIPVIICSVLEDPDLARSLGAAAYLHKPIAQAALLSALDDLSGVG